MVDSKPILPFAGGPVPGSVPDGGRRALPPAAAPGPIRLPATGRPGNRWPTARELAALLVDGILRLPERYRRGMYLDILV